MNMMKLAMISGIVCASAVYVMADCGTCGAGAAKCDPASAPAVEKAAAKAAEPTISTAGLAALIRAKTPLVVLDARAAKWDDGKRIPGAVSLAADAKNDAIGKALPDKQSLIVTYCAGLTCPASHQLAERLAKLGYVNVVEYPEGIAGWQKAGNKIDEPQSK